MDPATGFGYDEPARPARAFRKRVVPTTEPAEADEPPDGEPPADEPAVAAVSAAGPVAGEPAIPPTLAELGEAHFWPHARMAGDLSSPGAAGVHIPHPEYWPMVREICDRYGVLLIADEVITGFGRQPAAGKERGMTRNLVTTDAEPEGVRRQPEAPPGPPARLRALPVGDPG
ncbi:MAG TPA: aminotransferase class III-fold pyridoxal phosphate-dependent enzyme [Trebonia sp.]